MCVQWVPIHVVAVQMMMALADSNVHLNETTPAAVFIEPVPFELNVNDEGLIAAFDHVPIIAC